MIKLNAKGLKWLKGFHLLAVSSWIGGVVALVLLYTLKTDVNNDGVLYGINQSIHHVDMVVIVPSALSCLLTGLLLFLLKNWGFVKPNWIIFKLIVTITAILFGIFYLGPWETAMMEISGKLGMASLIDDTYLYNQRMLLIFGTIQCLILMVTIFVAIFKTMGKEKNKR